MCPFQPADLTTGRAVQPGQSDRSLCRWVPELCWFKDLGSPPPLFMSGLDRTLIFFSSLPSWHILYFLSDPSMFFHKGRMTYVKARRGISLLLNSIIALFPFLSTLGHCIGVSCCWNGLFWNETHTFLVIDNGLIICGSCITAQSLISMKYHKGTMI